LRHDGQFDTFHSIEAPLPVSGASVLSFGNKMSIARFILVFISIVLSGCSTPVVSKTEFQRAVASHAHETICTFRYMGTKDGFHYFKLASTYGSRPYRVPQEEWRLTTTFPLTKDEARWRFVDARGEFLANPPAVMFYVPEEFMK
jgi:hypothetical protein